MQVFQFGDPKLFVKGVASITISDLKGNVIGYDNTPSESSATGSVNAGEITGGIGAPILITTPDTSRLEGTLTSPVFSLRARQMITGGTLKKNGIVQVCATNVMATSAGVLKLAAADLASVPPVKHYAQSASDTYAWAYVKLHGATSYAGTNVGISVTDGTVQGSYTPDAAYDIFYYSNPASADELSIPSNFIPEVAAVEIKYNVYSKQGSTNASGSLAGYLSLVVPRAQFRGDPGINASQTDAATTDYSWIALRPDDDVQPTTDYRDCTNESSAYAYYVYVPCGDVSESVEALYIPTGVVKAATGASVEIPVKYLMKDGQSAQPAYGDLTYVLTPTSLGTITNGIFKAANSAATGEVTVTLKNDTTKTVVANVVVA